MSRDWTPEETYLVELSNIKNGLGSWWDHMENATWSFNGVTRPLVSKEALAHRKEYPLLGRLFEEYDNLYSSLSRVKGGMEILDRHEKELDAYIQSGEGNPDSPVIKWFKGELDTNFYYNERNDELFLVYMQDEVGKLLRFDPVQDSCHWFPLNEDKCISVWLYPDSHEGDQLLMKLEERSEDGSMGPHCKVLIDESFGTGKITEKAVCDCLENIYYVAGLSQLAEKGSKELTKHVMAVFGLRKPSLEEQIQSAQRQNVSSEHTPKSKKLTPER